MAYNVKMRIKSGVEVMKMDAALDCFGGAASVSSTHMNYSQNFRQSKNSMATLCPWTSKWSADSSSSIVRTTIRRDVASGSSEEALVQPFREDLTPREVRVSTVTRQTSTLAGPVHPIREIPTEGIIFTNLKEKKKKTNG
jgi:hypothetical protein